MNLTARLPVTAVPPPPRDDECCLLLEEVGVAPVRVVELAVQFPVVEDMAALVRLFLLFRLPSSNEQVNWECCDVLAASLLFLRTRQLFSMIEDDA